MEFPTKIDNDVTGASYGDILMMQEIFVDDTYIYLKGVVWVLCTDVLSVTFGS